MEREYAIYAVDFDGTLSFGKWPNVGAPNKELIDFLKTKRLVGDKVILWTCREDENLLAAVNYCKEYGLEFDAVNDNLPEMKESFGNSPRKIYADYYIDDHNLFMRMNSTLIVEGEINVN